MLVVKCGTLILKNVKLPRFSILEKVNSCGSRKRLCKEKNNFFIFHEANRVSKNILEVCYFFFITYKNDLFMKKGMFATVVFHWNMFIFSSVL